VLKDKLFKPAVIKQLRTTMLKKLTQQPTPSDYSQRIDAVERKIEAAEHRLLEVSKDMIPRVEAQIRQLMQQKQEIEAAATHVPGKPTLNQADVSQRIDAALAWFSKLERLASGKHSSVKLRQMLQQFISSVELCFERKLWGKSNSRYKCELVGGTINFQLWGCAHIGPPMQASSYTDFTQDFTVAIHWGNRAA
jgi:hypothetical protein